MPFPGQGSSHGRKLGDVFLRGQFCSLGGALLWYVSLSRECLISDPEFEQRACMEVRPRARIETSSTTVLAGALLLATLCLAVPSLHSIITYCILKALSALE